MIQSIKQLEKFKISERIKKLAVKWSYLRMLDSRLTRTLNAAPHGF
jgi:hypothetical protein